MALVEGVVKQLTFVAALCALSCRDPGLQSSMGPLHLMPDQVNFGSLYVGQTAVAHATVLNDGRATVELSWSTPAAPFQMVDPPANAASGETDVVLSVHPVSAGDFRSVLAFDSEGTHHEIELIGTANGIPQCPPVDCQVSTFDLESGNCVQAPMPDGVACDMQSVCVTGGTCMSGRCVGTPRSCDDGNACTVDVCNSTTGCEHLPAPPCPGDGSCMKGVCNPQSGCGLTPADDGTA